MTENILYYHCFAGISGDMHLAALLNLGVPESYLKQELNKLSLEDEFSLLISKDSKKGIYGTKVEVQLKHTPHSHRHSHRDYKAIRSMIDHSALEFSVKQRALSIFEAIADAEATIHSESINDVHFHEVGATDSIVDIVGSAICLEYLIEHFAIAKIVCSTVELGSGFIDCDHGCYPIPAPATAQILEGVPVTTQGVNGEATTPTGAAILKACVDDFCDQLKGTIKRTVYGIGHRDTDLPNVLRTQIISREKPPSINTDRNPGQIKIEANIDDMNPEAFSPLYDRLFEAGADDVFVQHIMMKKTRPAFLLNVLCTENKADAISDVIFNNCSTIGLRQTSFEKRLLERENRTIETSVGEVQIKVVVQPDGFIRWKSEHDDIARLAQVLGEPYFSLKKRIDQEILNHLAPKAEAKFKAEIEENMRSLNEPTG